MAVCTVDDSAHSWRECGHLVKVCTLDDSMHTSWVWSLYDNMHTWWQYAHLMTMHTLDESALDLLTLWGRQMALVSVCNTLQHMKGIQLGRNIDVFCFSRTGILEGNAVTILVTYKKNIAYTRQYLWNEIFYKALILLHTHTMPLLPAHTFYSLCIFDMY